MKYSSRKPLVIALAIPVLFVSMVAAMLIISRLYSAPPMYNFIYSLGNDWSNTFDYRVISGKLQKVPRSNCPQQCSQPRPDPVLYVYDAKANRSTEISIEAAGELKLDPSQQSPDGYRVVRGNNSGGGLFLSVGPNYDYSTMYLSGAGGQFPINLASSGTSIGYSYGYSNTSFIAWIIP